MQAPASIIKATLCIYCAFSLQEMFSSRRTCRVISSSSSVVAALAAEAGFEIGTMVAIAVVLVVDFGVLAAAALVSVLAVRASVAGPAFSILSSSLDFFLRSSWLREGCDGQGSALPAGAIPRLSPFGRVVSLGGGERLSRKRSPARSARALLRDGDFASRPVGRGSVCAAGDLSKAAPAYHCNEVVAKTASALARSRACFAPSADGGSCGCGGDSADGNAVFGRLSLALSLATFAEPVSSVFTLALVLLFVFVPVPVLVLLLPSPSLSPALAPGTESSLRI